MWQDPPWSAGSLSEWQCLGTRRLWEGLRESLSVASPLRPLDFLREISGPSPMCTGGGGGDILGLQGTALRGNKLFQASLHFDMLCLNLLAGNEGQALLRCPKDLEVDWEMGLENGLTRKPQTGSSPSSSLNGSGQGRSYCMF